MDRRGFLRFLPAVPVAAIGAAGTPAAAPVPVPPPPAVTLPRIAYGSPMSSAALNQVIADIETALNVARDVCGIPDKSRGA
jgi:hypothetical protein